jgi:hypothetical protein
MQIDYKPLAFYVDKLKAGQKFAFVRYGNGEWDCTLSLRKHTGSGSQWFTSELRTAMAETLTSAPSDEYYIASQSAPYLTRKHIMPKADVWLRENAPGIAWVDGEVLHKASLRGRLYPFVEAIQRERIVVVGPQWLLKLPFTRTFINVKAKDCWDDYENILGRIRGHNFSNAIILFSAGPTAKVLIRQLWREKPGANWLIDCGSLWDPYCGVKSRNYHKRIKPGVLRRNLRGYNG